MTMGLVHAARQIEAHGRGPDKSLAHISPDESAMLDYMQGGRRMNPATGLAEYGMFGKILKAVAKIGASTVGFMYGGPLGAAAASAAVSKLTGDSWKQALTTGAISGVTSGIGSYAQGVGKGVTGLNKLGEIATTSGNTIAAGAVAPAVNLTAPLVGPGANSVSEAVKAGTMGATGLGVLAPSNIMNAGYGALGAGLGAAISTKPKPATPLSLPPAPPYDPNNVFSWLKRPSQTVYPTAPAPMPLYDPDRGYADGGEVEPVGMGLPPSAAMPQLMSAAQWGYVNARRGGRISGPSDGSGMDDQIPAMLTDGEHVLDKEYVDLKGQGSNERGHKIIEREKRALRKKAGIPAPYKPAAARAKSKSRA